MGRYDARHHRLPRAAGVVSVRHARGGEGGRGPEAAGLSGRRHGAPVAGSVRTDARRAAQRAVRPMSFLGGNLLVAVVL